MKLALCLAVLVLVLAPAGFAAPGAVHCGKLVDVSSGKLLVDQVIVFDGNGMVTAVGAATSTTLPQDVTPIDLSGSTCLPGLIDVHTHLTADPADNGYAGLGVSIPREAIIGAKNANKTVRAGFTTVRNVGADDYSDVALRDGINAGDIDGPRMLVSGLGARNHRRTLRRKPARARISLQRRRRCGWTVGGARQGARSG